VDKDNYTLEGLYYNLDQASILLYLTLLWQVFLETTVFLEENITIKYQYIMQTIVMV
jgi:hypothetical protein